MPFPREQFQEAKSRHPGMVFLFKQKDGYEAYYEDATVAEIVLELRRKPSDLQCVVIAEAALESSLVKFLQAGHRCAILEPFFGRPNLRAIRPVSAP